MLREFKEADECFKNNKIELPVAEWKQDKQQVGKLLAQGRQAGEEIVERLLAPNSYPTPKAEKHGFTDIQKLKFFKESNEALGRENWGITATDQAAQLTAIIRKLLPEEVPLGTNTSNEWIHETQ